MYLHVCFFLSMYEIIFLLDFVQLKFIKDHLKKSSKAAAVVWIYISYKNRKRRRRKGMIN